MKLQLILLLLLAAKLCSAQFSTLTTIDGKVRTGNLKYRDSTITKLEKDGIITTYPDSTIRSFTEGKLSLLNDVPIPDSTKLLVFNAQSAGKNLKSAGALGLGGLSTVILGGVLAGISATQEKPSKPLTYIGLGVCGIGLGLEVFSFIKLIQAGNDLKYYESGR